MAAVPGEIPQEIGYAYCKVLVGCLERTIRHFRQTFYVYDAPEKVTFSGTSNATFSFDATGVFNHPQHRCEAWIEAKGHKDGGKVFDGFKEFLAKSYVATVLNARNSADLFWFVTNVPFGSTIGRDLTSHEFILRTLTTDRSSSIGTLIGTLPVDPDHVKSLASRVAVGVFTDSYIRVMGVSYLVQAGDSVWRIIKTLHGNRMPLFGPIPDLVARLNNLKDPNKIRSGSHLHVPWYGIRWD
jgi:hypothetical protein